MNQTSAPSFVVPVLPPAGTRNCAPDGARRGAAPHDVLHHAHHQPRLFGRQHRHCAAASAPTAPRPARSPRARSRSASRECRASANARVRGDHLDRIDVGRADEDRRIGRDRRRDAEAARHRRSTVLRRRAPCRRCIAAMLRDWYSAAPHGDLARRTSRRSSAASTSPPSPMRHRRSASRPTMT